MNRLLFWLWITAVILSIASCEDNLLAEDEVLNAPQLLDQLWEDFEQHYALFDVKQIDWDNVYDRYRPMVSTGTSEEELWQVLTGMLEELNDGHVTLVNPYRGWDFESGDSLNRAALSLFSLDVVRDNYLSNWQATREVGMSYGKLADRSVGYVHLYGVDGEAPQTIDEVMIDLRSEQAVILDVRNNGGGNDDYAHRVAAAFSDGEHYVYNVQTKNGPGAMDFDAPNRWYTSSGIDGAYTKPVMVLMDRFTASGAEILVLNLRAFSHVVTLGDTTAGDFSDQSQLRFLSNGWLYTLSPQLYLLPNGECLEGVGIAPDIVSSNTTTELANGQDRVLERALQYLADEYGI